MKVDSLVGTISDVSIVLMVCTQEFLYSCIYVIKSLDRSYEAARYGKRPQDSFAPVNINNYGGLLHYI